MSTLYRIKLSNTEDVYGSDQSLYIASVKCIADDGPSVTISRPGDRGITIALADWAGFMQLIKDINTQLGTDYDC